MIGLTNVNVANTDDAYAAITVNYTAGAAVYITNGERNLYATGTTGKEVFFVPSAGTWSVYMNGSRKTGVSITQEGQSASVTVS